MASRWFICMIARIRGIFRGYAECRGTFRVLDEAGRPLDGVRVSYRIGEGVWVAGGKSLGHAASCRFRRTADKPPNYIQPSPVFYRIGDPVSWRFDKEGYRESVVTRYTAGLEFFCEPTVVQLQPESSCRRPDCH